MEVLDQVFKLEGAHVFGNCKLLLIQVGIMLIGFYFAMNYQMVSLVSLGGAIVFGCFCGYSDLCSVYRMTLKGKAGLR